VKQKSLIKIISGAKAKQEGDAFQDFFFSACHAAGIYAIRFPDGARKVRGPGGKLRMIPVETPFDFILIGDGKSAYVDTKSISAERISYSLLKAHQVDVLKDIQDRNLKAGYVVHFKKTNDVYFFAANILQSLNARQSLSPEDGQFMGNLFRLSLKGFV
jgi:hypothetical protein